MLPSIADHGRNLGRQRGRRRRRRLLRRRPVTEFGGQPVTNLSRIKPGGSVDAAFTHPDSEVTALAFLGGSVHAGGNFLTIGGQTATPRSTEMNATTGAFDTTFTRALNAAALAIATNPAGRAPIHLQLCDARVWLVRRARGQRPARSAGARQN